MNAKFWRNAAGDAKQSVKWALWLFPVWLGIIFGAAYLFGGIHDWGGLPILIGEAPVVLLQMFFRLNFSDSPLGWVFVVALDWIYFFLLVVLFRFILNVDALTSETDPKIESIGDGCLQPAFSRTGFRRAGRAA